MDPREETIEMKLPPLLVVLSAIAALMMAVATWRVFFEAPTEEVMGFVQKIFYFHVPSAWLMFWSVGILAAGSVGYLVRRTDAWDRVADAGVELALVFGSIVLITGPLWGRKAWGTYWVWDVRLTSTLVLMLTLVATKIVRGYAGASSKTIAAALSIFAVLNTAFVYYSVNIWRGTHPANVVQGKLDPEMARVFWFCVLTFHFAFGCLLWLRLRLGKLENALDRLHMRAAEAGIDD